MTSAVMEETLHEKKRPVEAEESSQAKKAKVQESGHTDKIKAIQVQIMYYMSDKNLAQDKFFYPLIEANAEGWLDTKHILACHKIKQLTQQKEDIIEAMKGQTDLETKLDENNDFFIRRTKPLPPFQAEAKAKIDAKKKNKSYPQCVESIHQFGALLKAEKIPAEISWVKLKQAFAEKFQALNPDVANAKIRNVTAPNTKGVAYIYMKKFDRDEESLEKVTEVVLGGATVAINVIRDIPTAVEAIDALPAHIAKDREREYNRYKSQLKTKPLMIGSTRFDSIQHLRKCYQELLKTTRLDQELVEPGLSIIKDVLKYHPNATEKARDLVGIKVSAREDIPRKDDSDPIKCFFVQRSDGTSEDFSIVKCLDRIMENPQVFIAQKAN